MPRLSILLNLVTYSVAVQSFAVVHEGRLVDVKLDPESREITKRSIASTGTLYGENDPFPFSCNNDQINAIARGVDDAVELANAAISSLSIGGSQNSAAYQRFFGASNANDATRIAINVGNFQGVVANMADPFDNFLDGLQQDMGANSLTYMCPAADYPSCASGSLAAAYQSGDGRIIGNVMAICPIYFTNTLDQSVFLTNIASNTPTQGSRGFTLLHEAQHISDIVGPARRCDDKVAPSGNVAYSVSDCQALSDADKILNAQNMAFFATFVAAIPASGSHSENGACVISKRQTRASNREERREIEQGLRKRQTTPCQSSALGPLPSGEVTGFSDVAAIGPADIDAALSQASPTATPAP